MSFFFLLFFLLSSVCIFCRLYEILSLPMDRRQEVARSSRSPTEQTLFAWQSRVGSQATTGALLDALAMMQRQDAIDTINESML